LRAAGFALAAVFGAAFAGDFVLALVVTAMGYSVLTRIILTDGSLFSANGIG
jgi:hypothetical protein